MCGLCALSEVRVHLLNVVSHHVLQLLKPLLECREELFSLYPKLLLVRSDHHRRCPESLRLRGTRLLSPRIQRRTHGVELCPDGFGGAQSESCSQPNHLVELLGGSFSCSAAGPIEHDDGVLIQRPEIRKALLSANNSIPPDLIAVGEKPR